jgi:F0F1-type ATP synthase assembly protein I
MKIGVWIVTIDLMRMEDLVDNNNPVNNKLGNMVKFVNGNNMKIDKRALGTSLLLTGSVLLGALVGTLLVKYANPAITMTLLIGVMIVFFYFVFKD